MEPSTFNLQPSTCRESDLHDVHTILGTEDARMLKLKAAALAHFMRAKDKHAAAAFLQQQFGDTLSGISEKRLYALSKKFDGTLVSLMDGRQLRRLEAGGLAQNKDFVAYWQQLCLENKRKTEPAYRELFRHLRAGEQIPGFGDWRTIWMMENGGRFPDMDRACPYQPTSLTPRGWSLRNLKRLKPDAWALVAGRKGTMAARMETLPDISRTRVGLKCCRVVQIDDMWYEHKVAFGTNRHAQRVVEFSMIDVATGKVFQYLPKPVLEREDGHKETLKSAWTRYLIANLLCNVGIPEEGVQIMGEHGTASADGYLEEVLARETGGLVTFGAGGVLSGPLFAGGFGGTPKGNPRYKGLLEGFHSLIKNELASVAGHMGGGREGKSEYVYGMEQTDERLRTFVRALEQTRPGIGSRLTLPFMDYYDFRTIIDAAYSWINSRREHRLEGWDGQGFMIPEYFSPSAAAWLPIADVQKENPIVQKSIMDSISNGSIKVRRTRMSPDEAWLARAADHPKKFDPVIGMLVMGDDLSVLCTCDQKLTLHYKNVATFTDVEIVGILEGGGSLTRGDNYRVWVNPFDACRAIVADMQGRYIGVAHVKEAHRYDDIEGIKKSIGVTNAALAAERKRLQPVLNRMAAKQYATTRANAAVILGEDPALLAARRDAAGYEVAHAAPAADLDFDDTPYFDNPSPTVDANDLADL